MRSETPEGFCSIPSATGGIARLACARLRELGKDAAGILAKVGARLEQVNDDAVRLEVPKQVRILELVAEDRRPSARARLSPVGGRESRAAVTPTC